MPGLGGFVSLMRALVLSFVFSLALSAQEFRGSISGRIVDPSGAAVPHAVVEARNAATNTFCQSFF